MLCGSGSQIYAHKYWFSSHFFSSVQPFIYPAAPRPWVWGEKQLADCGSMKGTRHKILTTLPGIIYIYMLFIWQPHSAAEYNPALRGMHMKVRLPLCKHFILHRPPDPFFCLNNNAPATHQQTEWQTLEKRQHLACRVKIPSLPANKARQRETGVKLEREKVTYPLSSSTFHTLTTQNTLKL